MKGNSDMFKRILVPVDLADTELAKSAIETAVSLSRASGGSIVARDTQLQTLRVL